MVEVVTALGTSARRREILRGLLRYRGELRRVGVANAFQWLDGSFAEQIAREPNDVDVVTFAATSPAPATLQPGDRNLFSSTHTKPAFLCDAYFVQLASPTVAVDRSAYWFGVFSHRRGSYEWKGLVQTPLDDVRDDAAATLELDRLDALGGP